MGSSGGGGPGRVLAMWADWGSEYTHALGVVLTGGAALHAFQLGLDLGKGLLSVCLLALLFLGVEANDVAPSPLALTDHHLLDLEVLCDG